eukprot:TRINITY_DN354_c0_g1_i1.p2 TRINITY_DN354_c0_g1~~TRINITY_DN354_c0_g1_i1.p2  ORF type:complete len:194 (-),score=1.67 TRINITY_DN354_c0_g1_i1:232-813(-)
MVLLPFACIQFSQYFSSIKILNQSNKQLSLLILYLQQPIYSEQFYNRLNFTIQVNVMMKFLLALVLVVAVSGQEPIAAFVPGCTCTKEYDPVCCPGGKTYGNRCAARCAGVDPDTCTPGECPECSHQVACLLDPCSLTSCPSHSCHSHNCNVDQNLYGVTVGPCVAVYVHDVTGQATANVCPVALKYAAANNP